MKTISIGLPHNPIFKTYYTERLEYDPTCLLTHEPMRSTTDWSIVVYSWNPLHLRLNNDEGLIRSIPPSRSYMKRCKWKWQWKNIWMQIDAKRLKLRFLIRYGQNKSTLSLIFNWKAIYIGKCLPLHRVQNWKRITFTICFQISDWECRSYKGSLAIWQKQRKMRKSFLLIDFVLLKWFAMDSQMSVSFLRRSFWYWCASVWSPLNRKWCKEHIYTYVVYRHQSNEVKQRFVATLYEKRRNQSTQWS